jgi:membrane protease YdiL (CAAX protease family)
VAWLDLIYQLTGIAFALVPVALALYLLAVRPGPKGAMDSAGPMRGAARRLGFDLRRPGRDLGYGVALALGIGLPGIGLYLVGRAAGITMHISTANLGEQWWTVPVLVAIAVRAGIEEEVLAVGYLVTRLEQLRWPPWAVVATSALLRGSYHLYQGVGPFLGNVVMGVVFALVYLRTRRVMALVMGHALMDTVAFLGPSLLDPAWLT